jgi:hypothetical protein
MASLTSYYSFLQKLSDGTIDWDTSAISATLHSAAYSPSRSHTQWSDVSASEFATANGYTAGGAALTSKAVAASGSDTRLSASVPAVNATGAGLTGVRYMIFRKGSGAGVASDPLIGYIDLQNGTGFNGTVANGYSLNVSFTNGFFLLMPGA